jgi:hypothetical protein
MPGATITNQTAANDSLSGLGGTAASTYRLNATGVAYYTDATGALTAISGEWLTSGAAALYEAQGVWGAGTGTTGGPTGWVALNVTRDWTLTRTNNFANRDLALQIRVAATGVVLASATISFEVDSAP